MEKKEREKLRELLVDSVPTCDDVCYHCYLELLIDMRQLLLNPTPEVIKKIRESWKHDLKINYYKDSSDCWQFGNHETCNNSQFCAIIYQCREKQERVEDKN